MYFAFNRTSCQLSHASAKTESENNRRAAQGTVTELHTTAHLIRLECSSYWSKDY